VTTASKPMSTLVITSIGPQGPSIVITTPAPTLTTILNASGDRGQIQDAANEVGIDPHDLGNYVHELKADGEFGSKNDKGDFTYAELVELAKQLKGD
jgi:hypothetical protein